MAPNFLKRLFSNKHQQCQKNISTNIILLLKKLKESHYPSKVLNQTLTVPRGGYQDVQLQFTIPFVNRHFTFGTIDDQPYLQIRMDIHNSSSDCKDDNKETCGTKVYAYKKQNTSRYDTDDWKVIHKVRVYNKDDNDFNDIDTHITLRLKTASTRGIGSRIFDKLTLADIQVKYQI